MPTLSDPPSSTRAFAHGAHRGAIVLTALGTELAARVLSQLDESEVETLIQAMTRLGYVPADERDRVLQECETELSRFAGGLVGGAEYTRRLLEETVGPEKAARYFGGPAASAPSSRTLQEILRDTPVEALTALVAEEHPQTITLLVSQLPMEKAALFLTALPETLQGPVTARLVELEAPAPRALQHLARCLSEKLGGMPVGGDAQPAAGGPRHVADLLGRMRRSVENGLLHSLEQQSPALLQKVNRFRFTFEQLLEQENRTLQRVMREVDGATLPLVIKGLDDAQQELLYRNMSERAAERIREEVASLGPVRLRDVEAAQQTLVTTAKELEERGEVTLKTAAGAEEGGEEEAFV